MSFAEHILKSASVRFNGSIVQNVLTGGRHD